ncbi:MAG: energy transducer TonB [Acidobacteriota bacterium]|nr:energy transducer TonB [Acidobacteriota bacterium]
MMRFPVIALMVAALLFPFNCVIARAWHRVSLEPSAKKALAFERCAAIPSQYALYPQRRHAKSHRHEKSAVNSPQSEEDSKPSPLTLVVRIDENQNIFLNTEEAGTLNDSSLLTSRLLTVFAERKNQRAFKRGMEMRSNIALDERIEKTLYVHAHPTLKQDEVAKLVEDIKGAGANPVIIVGDDEYREKFGWLFEPERFGWSPPANQKPTAREVLDGGVLNGKALSQPRPGYPPAAVGRHLSGIVIVRVTIDETGKVISARAVSGPSLLQEAAVAAARQATFAPTSLLGKPVRVRGLIRYSFVGK